MSDKFNETKLTFSIEVFEDYAVIKGFLCIVIKGFLCIKLLKVLLKLCKDEGFKYLVPNEDGGFKLIKEAE